MLLNYNIKQLEITCLEVVLDQPTKMKLRKETSNGMIFIRRLRIVIFTVWVFLFSFLYAQDFSNDSVSINQQDSLIEKNSQSLTRFISEDAKFVNDLNKYIVESDKKTNSDINLVSGRNKPIIFIGKGVVVYDPKGILKSEKNVIVSERAEAVATTKSEKIVEKVSKKTQETNVEERANKQVKITSSPPSKSSFGLSSDHFSFAVVSTTFIKFNKALIVDSIDKSNILFLWQIKTIFYSRYLFKSFYLERDFFIRPPPFFV